MDDGAVFGRQSGPSWIILVRHFIAIAPKNDGGMIAVATDQRPQVRFVPVGIEQMVVIGGFTGDPAVESFVHDQETHLIAQVQQLGCRRVMAGADGVHPEFTKNLQLPLQGPAIDGRAQGTQVVMIANAVQFDVPAIQKETAV